MALPLAPLVPVVLKYGSVALAAWLLARHVSPARVDQRSEDALDDLPEGLTAARARDREQVNATGRFRRVITLVRSGRAIEIDAAFLARFRARQL
ncbi:MAG: hypothetical protein JJU19_03945 [Pararhodobacter sp.]|nr:hypothetical protein [Pararhodobacter sp.]